MIFLCVTSKENLEMFGVVWIIKSLEAVTTNNETIDKLIPPPPVELVTLYQAAQIGDIVSVEVEATHLRQLAPQSADFANKLLQLAQEFEEEKILNLVEKYISEK